MPVVPFNNRPQAAQPRPIDFGEMEPFALMAAAQMDAEGRLVEPHTISEGPEYDKWDEAITQHGAIRIPKSLDNPQQWLNDHQKKLDSNGIIREDRPDGSVILRKQGWTS
jgi:hypothetical protein